VGYRGTHVHFGRNAESITVPDTPRPFPLKSATVMVVSMVTDLLLSPPLNVKFVNALLSEDILGMSV
jgi:hypothetical protein